MDGGSSFWKITLAVGCGVLLAMALMFGMCSAFVGKVALDASKQKDEKRQALATLNIRDLDGKKDGDWIKVFNGGSASVSFVKVEAEFLDGADNVIDKDWTYAVGAEKLSPGQAKSFEIMQRGGSTAKSYRVHVLAD